MTKTGSRSRTVSDRKHNNISFQRKENRLLEPNQQKFVPNKEQAPRAKRSRTLTLILGFNVLVTTSKCCFFFKAKRSRTVYDQNRLPEPNGLRPYTPNYFSETKRLSETSGPGLGRFGCDTVKLKPRVYSNYKESLQCTDASLRVCP